MRFKWLDFFKRGVPYLKSEVTKEMVSDANGNFCTLANYLWRGRLFLAIGGYIKLTSTEIVFKPHNLNFSQNIVTINLKDIKKTTPLKLLGVFDRGVIIYTKSNIKYKFIISPVAAKVLLGELTVDVKSIEKES